MLAAGFRAGVGGTDQAVRKPVRVFENRFAVVLPYPKTHAAIDRSEARELPRLRKADKAGNGGDNDLARIAAQRRTLLIGDKI